MVATTEKTNIGRISQIIGPVVDAQFPSGKMPRIYNALKVEGKNSAGEDVSVTCEVQQLLGDRTNDLRNPANICFFCCGYHVYVYLVV